MLRTTDKQQPAYQHNAGSQPVRLDPMYWAPFRGADVTASIQGLRSGLLSWRPLRGLYRV